MYAKNESGGRKVVVSIDKGALTGRPYIPKYGPQILNRAQKVSPIQLVDSCPFV